MAMKPFNDAVSDGVIGCGAKMFGSKNSFQRADSNCRWSQWRESQSVKSMCRGKLWPLFRQCCPPVEWLLASG